jgi:hypothetical protein
MADRNLGAQMEWWVGVVEDVMDPTQSGRVRVRVKSKHDDKTNITIGDLPWAVVMMPVTSAAAGKMGTAPVGLVVGSTVMGYWADSDNQIPIVMGSLPKAGNDPPTTVGGAPTIDLDRGSTVGAAQSANGMSVSLNPFSALSTTRRSILEIDNRTVSINDITGSEGNVITNELQKLLSYAQIPTHAWLDKNTPLGWYPAFTNTDPTFSMSALPCMPTAMSTATALGGIIGTFAQRGLQIAVTALKNAILKAARGSIGDNSIGTGLFAMLKKLNEAVNSVKAVFNVIQAFQSGFCGPNTGRQVAQNEGDLTFAKVVHDLNVMTGYIHGVTTSISAITRRRTFASILSAPDYSVATATTPVPLSTSVVLTPPPNYTQIYHTINNDPYPGYIEWNDQSLANSVPVYTLRKNQPNYTSSNQHANFHAENSFLPTIKSTFGVDFSNLKFDGASLANTINSFVPAARMAGQAFSLGIGIITHPEAIVAVGQALMSAVMGTLQAAQTALKTMQLAFAAAAGPSVGFFTTIKTYIKLLASIIKFFSLKWLTTQVNAFRKRTLIQIAMQKN